MQYKSKIGEHCRWERSPRNRIKFSQRLWQERKNRQIYMQSSCGSGCYAQTEFFLSLCDSEVIVISVRLIRFFALVKLWVKIKMRPAYLDFCHILVVWVERGVCSFKKKSTFSVTWEGKLKCQSLYSGVCGITSSCLADSSVLTEWDSNVMNNKPEY